MNHLMVQISSQLYWVAFEHLAPEEHEDQWPPIIHKLIQFELVSIEILPSATVVASLNYPKLLDLSLN